MSNMEMIPMNPIQNPELALHGSPLAISDVQRLSYPSLGKDHAYEGLDDIKETPTSSVPLLTPVKTCQGGSLLLSVWRWALAFLVPAISIAYLTFCYVVHYRVVPANVSGLSADTTTQFLTNVGSVITTVNIIIISLALFPLKGLLYELKSEEFFRLLSRKSRGVELTAINGISNSSYGFIESLMVIVNRHCSLYYVMAFVAAVCVWVVSSLAPAALSIQSILIDGATMAFSVGAIPPLALYQPVNSGQILTPSAFSPAPGYSAAIAWAEREIGLSYSFSVLNDSQGVYAGFVVPTPSPALLNSSMSARWLTDVVGVNPYCTWANPGNLTAASLNFTLNSTNFPTTAVSVHLEDVDLQVSVPSAYFPAYDSFFVTSINVHDPTVTVLNYTTGNLPTDGAMVMSVIQCTSPSCTEKAIDIIALFVDFTDVPSMRFSTIGADYELGFLVCKPNITIETREVRTQGSMTLQVQALAEGASPYPRQGNLDWTQTSLLVSYSLSALSTDSGPESSAWSGLGSQTQAHFVFGADQLNSIPSSNPVYENTTTVLTPLSTDQLTQGYTQLVKASMKPYVTGSLGTSYVPGRIASVQQIFVSSMPHVIASTVFIILLFVMAIVAYFRRGKGDQFNLTNVAAALADSELPEMAKKAKVDVMVEGQPYASHGRWLGSNVGQDVARKLGNWKVSLKDPDKADGVETLHVSRE